MALAVTINGPRKNEANHETHKANNTLVEPLDVMILTTLSY
jgi:hypothetical protein